MPVTVCRRFLVLLVLVVFSYAGCDSGSTSLPSGAGPVPSDTSLAGGIQGHLVQVNPVFLVESLDAAPEGAEPVEGAMVAGYDSAGTLVGMSLTREDGMFLLESAQAGMVRLEGRSNASQLEPEVVVEVTAVPEAIIRPGLGFGVSRVAATQVVLEDVPPTALVTLTQQPLPTGTTVSQAFDDELQPRMLRRLPGPEYLAMIDPAPFVRLTHPVVYRFVDADTGELTAEIDALSYPLLDGLPMWASEFEFYDFTEYVSGVLNGLPATLPPTLPDVVQAPSLQAYQDLPAPERLLHQEAGARAEDVFVILVQGDEGRSYEVDIANVREFFLDAGVPDEQILTVAAHRSVSKVAAEDALKTAIAIQKAKVQIRLNSGRRSTLVYYHTSHSSSGSLSLGKSTMRPEMLVKEQPNVAFFDLLGIKACKIRILADGCQTGTFGLVLINQLTLNDPLRQKFPQDLRIFTATDGAMDSGANFVQGGNWTSLLVDQMRLTDADLEGIATPPSPGGVMGTVIGELGEVTTYQEGFFRFFLARVKQNPQAFFRPGAPPYCQTLTMDTVPEIPLLDTEALLRFVNETNDSVDLSLESSTAPINGGTVISLGPAGSGSNVFEQTVAGPIMNVTLKDFSPPQGLVSALETGVDIQVGTVQEFIWQDSDGARTLVIPSPQQAFPQ